MTLFALFACPAGATTFPADFSEQSVARPDGQAWSEVVGIAFSSSGRMFVWERGGRVWVVDSENPVTQPLVNLSDVGGTGEVLGWRDHGLLGFALHPDFDNTGYLYLMYTVDRHHLERCDSPVQGEPVCTNYDPTVSWPPNDPAFPGYRKATIGRIVRYQAVKPPGDPDYTRASAIDYSSRRVLLGATSIGQPMRGGIPLLHESHGVGSLVFGADGTLLASAGDNASYSSTDVGSASETYYASALADGIIETKENVGAFRAQLVDSLAGKLLRLDPETGDGVASNPFYDVNSPRSARSRVWALGLRNPYRMTRRPGTGNPDPAVGNPGAFYLGDVGWNTWEDFHIAHVGGQNFGWPVFEGMEAHPDYSTRNTANLDAPNPAFGTGGCTQQHFYFRELIKQDSQNAVAFTNSCNMQPIPASTPVFVHARPAIDWRHGINSARFAAFNPTTGAAVAQPIGTVAPDGTFVSGTQFQGNTSTGGVWYRGNDFPSQYFDTYFHGDYGSQWIRNFVIEIIDGKDKPTAVRDFATGAGGVVALATHPTDGGLYYISWAAFVRKINYGPNQPPVAKASANPTSGPSPLTVQFNSAGSSDPNKDLLTYQWNFGDGSPPVTGPRPTYTYTVADGQPTFFTATLTVTDGRGGVSTATVQISVNTAANTPPQVQVQATCPPNGTTYMPGDSDMTCQVSAQISDTQTPTANLQCQWTEILYHNEHTHQTLLAPGCQLQLPRTVSRPGCDGETYSWGWQLTVTDPQGLATTQEARVSLIPDTTPPSVPTGLAATVSGTQVNLSWSPSTDAGGCRVATYRIYRDNRLIATISAPTTSYSDAGLRPNTRYRYRVSASDEPGNDSARTQQLQVKTSGSSL
ncbi:MAG TPA: PQQ-dependent sugar dehydrogenase [Burkholderiales bacterium]|nr:PQQ-dependent sugar dehydrogenase [Burkholderiales bacterium]